MGVLQRFERRLGGLVEGVFARAFKSEVQPVEVAAALQRELDDQAAVVGRDRTLVPNHFVVDLGDHNHARLVPYEQPLTHELSAMVREHAADQRYTFVGPVTVELAHVSALETGVFRVHSTVAPGPDSATPPGRASVVPSAPGIVVPSAPGTAPRTPASDLTPAAAPKPRFDATAAIPRPALTPTPALGRIVVREGKGPAYTYELKHQVTVVGRGTDADIRLTDQAVSRRHAEIRLANGLIMLNDLQSTNGTTVNGEAITTKPLADGDEVRLGETLLIYRAPAQSEARTPAGNPASDHAGTDRAGTDRAGNADAALDGSSRGPVDPGPRG